MKFYKIAATVRSGGRYIEHELAAMNMTGAFNAFVYWLGVNHLVGVDVLSELDISETGGSE
jgi:hypothetical protein